MQTTDERNHNASVASRRWAYNRTEATYEPDFVETTRGTRCGEYLRRFWHPVATSADATRTPNQVRVLGEDLILYRDGSDRVGLLYPRCAHRGTSLYFGRTEEHGIRCCYHGWAFEADGTCIDQPLEPGGGRARANYVQPCYPIEERYGLVFAYLGPPEKKPVLPRYECLEHLGPDQMISVDATSRGTDGPVIADFNWFQNYENVMDPYHVSILHDSFSGTQFVPEMGAIPRVEWSYVPFGMKAEGVRDLDDGRRLRRVTEVAFPTVRAVPSPTLAFTGPTPSVGWMVPIDDTTFRIYNATRVAKGAADGRRSQRPQGKTWFELTPEERRDAPGDYEAQRGQGVITLHSEDHLASTDRGVAMMRKLWREQVAIVASGGDPIGVAYTEEEAFIRLEAGNFFE